MISINKDKLKEIKLSLAKAECKRRIEKEWSLIDQSNVNLGIIEGAEAVKCKEWITSCRDVYAAMKLNSDIASLDVTDDARWPVYE